MLAANGKTVDSNKKYVVYHLSDPRNNAVRYIGITWDTYKRKYGHLSTAGKSNPAKQLWIKELKSLGLQPTLTEIEQADTKGQARSREQYWIREFITRGSSLFNIAMPGIVPIQETDNVLKRIRLEIGVSQEGFARRTQSVSTGTIKRAEDGQKVTYGTATQILEAVNTLLVADSKPLVTLDDLGLTLY